MSTVSQASWPTTAYHSGHTSWPYQPLDFRRADETEDNDFYSQPRFVTHIDDNAISTLSKYYSQVLPKKGRILDFCSSWISHYPIEVEDAVKEGQIEVIGMGMSEQELRKNPILKERILQDLNKAPTIPTSVGAIDAATCVVSVDYLTQPLLVLSSLRERMRRGGKVHLVISNRCFPTKAVQRWLRIGEEERLNMVGDYLWFAGWRDIEIVTLSDGKSDNSGGGGPFGWFGIGANDPLWVVRGTNAADDVRHSEL
ncbi:MAG: hypothetical protein M1827_000569 [Pycnora praestabilis]|nr:MAG: hypothetical protein M1827_000569 [Pycnora praestabilis]